MSAPSWPGPPHAGPVGFGPALAVPAARSPVPGGAGLRVLLVGTIALALLALAAFAVIGLTSRPATVGYANDDYTVPPPDASPPPIPFPDDVNQSVEWTKANAVYRTSVPAPVRCELPRLDLASADDAALKAHFEDLMACLVRVWYLPTKEAGFVLVRPTVTIYGEKVQTKCGTSGINAVYCAADQQVYYSRLIPTRAKILATNPWAADIIIAHEFGHAVQARTGILGGDLILEHQATDEHVKLQLSRRTETQADCFSALFARSVSSSIGLRQSDVPAILDSYFAFGSDVLRNKPNIESDHGLGATRRYWGNVGLATDQVGRCNTFTADGSLVR